jgi:putative transposase
VTAPIRKTMKTESQDAAHRMLRVLATETKLSKPTVHHIWRVFGLQPYRQKHFKLSTDPRGEGQGHCGALSRPCDLEHDLHI